VTSGSSSAISRGYTYDANSNRLTTSGTTSFTDTVAPASNQLNSTSGNIVRTYGYDAAGNTTSYTGSTGSTLTFNQRGRISVRTVSVGTTNYIYNALGQLIDKNGVGSTFLYMYDEAGHLLGEYNNIGTLIQETIWMGDTPVATLRLSGSTIAIYYVHTDHLGTPRKVTRPSDNGLMWRWDPDTFGSAQPNANPAGLGSFTYNLRFPGQFYMNESALFYNYFRTYDPTTGRYIESDPMGQLVYFSFSVSTLRMAAGLKYGYWNHLYNYADEKPIAERDRTGLGGILDLIKEALGDKTREEINGMSVGALLGALCAVQDCKKALNKSDPLFSTVLLTDCYSIISDLTKLRGGPAWVGVLQGSADGAQGAAQDCSEKCEDVLKKASQCCNGGAR
jgi:RHS repeat-associated protein